MSRASTVASPMPASKMRSAGGVGRSVPELARRALRDRRLLVAGVDERQVLLAVVVEAERRRGVSRGGLRLPRPARAHGARACRPATRSRTMRATCSPWKRHMPSSSSLGMRVSSPLPVMLLAPYGVPPVTSFMVMMPGAV